MKYLPTSMIIAALGIPFFSQGQELFEPKATLISQDNRRNLVLNDDFDNDGDQDLLVFRSEDDPDACCGGAYYLLNNNGDGDFSEEIAVSDGSVEWDNIRTGDLNSDGLPDLLVYLSDEQTVRWLQNNGDTGFSLEEPIISQYTEGSFEVDDLTGDGLDDILYTVFDTEEQLFLLTNQGNATFSAPVQVAAGELLHVADFDADSQPDFFTLDPQGSVVVWHQNNGDGTFTADTTDVINETQFFTPELLVGNFGGDAGNELIISYALAGDDGIVPSKLYTYENEAFVLQGSLVELDEFDLSPSNPVANDIDQDGDLDILASFSFALAFARTTSAFDEYVGWYENTGNFQFTPQLLDEALLAGTFIDLNNDQQLDIILDTSDELIWQENLGLGVFSSPRYLTDSRALLAAFSDEGGSSITFGNLNQDDLPEMVVTEGSTNKVLYFANQDSTLVASSRILTLSTLFPTDAAVLNNATNNLIVLGGDAIEGRGIYRYPIQENTTLGVKDTLYSGVLDATLFSGDFNGDNRPDLAFTDRALSVDGEVFLLISQADQTFATVDTKIIGTLESVYDVNNDGKTDLVIDSDIYTQISEDNFDLLLSPEFPYNHIEDINGDGKTDFLFFSDAEVTLYLANDDGTYQEQTLTFGADYDFTLAPWLLMDIDDDQDKDMVFINSTANVPELAYLLNLNSTTLFGEYTVLDEYTDENIQLFSHDIDQDTDSDLVVLADSQLAWYESNAWQEEEIEVPTNTPPTVANPIEDQAATVGQEFSLSIADDVFQDADEGDTLTLTAGLADGAALPEWLTFDVSTSILGGIPPEAGELTIRLTATDTSGASASDDFTLTVTEETITSLDDDVIKYLQLYPVPATETLVLESGSAALRFRSYRLMNLQGQTMQSQPLSAQSEVRIDVSSLARGVYLLEVQTTERVLQQRVLVE
jgi:hypothetical protein